MLLAQIFGSVFVLTQIGGILQGGDPDTFRLIKAPVSQVLLPTGFDSNDNAQIIIAGTFKNSCQSIEPAKAQIDLDKSTIYFRALASEMDGNCMAVKAPFVKSIDLGPLPVGEYKVVNVDAKDAPSSVLKIKKATTDSLDDYLYAPVDTVYVHPHPDTQQPLITFHGSFPDTCTNLFPERIVMKNTAPGLIEVLPIADYDDTQQDCKDAEIPFFRTIPVPQEIADGSYVIHVRTMGGGSLNKRINILRPKNEP